MIKDSFIFDGVPGPEEYLQKQKALHKQQKKNKLKKLKANLHQQEGI